MATTDSKSAAQSSPQSKPGPIEPLERVDKLIGHGEAVVLVTSLGFLVVLGFYRSLFESTKKWFGHPVLMEPPEWTTPTILLLVFVVGMLGLALAAQADKLINIDLFSRVLSARAKLVIRIVGNLFGCIISYFFIQTALHMRHVLDDTSTARKLLSDKTTQLVIPLTIGLVILHLLVKIAIDAIWLASGKTPPESAPGGAHGGSAKPDEPATPAAADDKGGGAA